MTTDATMLTAGQETSIAELLPDRNRSTNQPQAQSGFKLTPISEVMKRSLEIDWIIKGYIPANSTVMIFGAPASGKSLIAMEMAYCVGIGKGYHGCQVKQGTVIYIAGEGQAGINRRFKALTESKGSEADNLHVSDCSMDLCSTESLEQVLDAIEDIPDIALVIIDTLHRNSTGDENSAKDFATVMHSCDQLREATGATVLLVHHSGHTKGRGRGSSSMNAAMDVEYEVSNKGHAVTLQYTKAKDIEPPPDMNFTLKPFVVGRSAEGEDITAPVLVQGNASKPPAALKPEDRMILKHLKQLLPSGENAIAEDFYDFSGSSVTVQPDQFMVSKKAWLSACKEDIKVKSTNPEEARRKRFERSLDRLCKFGEVARNDADYFIIPQTDDDEQDLFFEKN